MKLRKFFLLGTFLLAGLAQAEDPHSGIYVERFAFAGNTVFSSDNLRALVHAYSGRTLYTEDLVEISRRITQHYTSAGYINSGALLDGPTGETYQIRIVEGNLTVVAVNSDGSLKASYIEDRVRRGLSSPLELQALQSAMTMLEQDPRIDYVKGSLLPGESPGQSRLQLDVFETDPLSIRFHTNNHLPSSVGEAQFITEIQHLNVSGRGDTFLLNLALAEGITSGFVQYRLPVNSNWEVDLSYSYGESLVVEEPFDQIDIESETNVIRLAATRDMLRSNLLSWSLGFALEGKSSEALLSDQPFDFTFGSLNGETDATIFILQNQLQYRTQKQVLVVRNVFRRGVGWFSTSNEPATDFKLLLTQLQYSRRLDLRGDADWLLLLRSNFQLTRDSLKSFERYPLGGHRSVRGYRENQLLRDNGFEVSAELRIPLSAPDSKNSFTLSLFSDYGRAWNSRSFEGDEDRFQSLSSVGAGFGYRSSRGVSIEIEWAARLNAKERQGSTWQDYGVHLSISYDW